MSNKKPIKKIFESSSIESADVKHNLAGSAPADSQSEATSPEMKPQEEGTRPSHDTEADSAENLFAAEQGDTESGLAGARNEGISSDNTSLIPRVAEEESPIEDLLDDVRQSLIEEESNQSQTESKWWQRIGRRTKKVNPEESPFLTEIDLSSLTDSSESVTAQLETNETEEEIDQLDDLMDLPKAETPSVEVVVPPWVEPSPEPEQEIDFEELKKQVFHPRGTEEDSEHFMDVRSIALDGGEEVLVEVETKAPDPLEERINAFENALKPYRQFINIALATLGIGIAIVASLIIYNVYQSSRPQPVKEVSNLPYPTGVSLPGGWTFNLGKGSLQNGEWNPRGAEWLEGTEVCRWVSLPWSRQLEAVVTTLNPKDPIELVMSNNDRLTYRVQSVRQLNSQELQNMDTNSPCLLLILTQPDAEKRWVLTALP